jgi:undecaprenyl diphosphate synthase
MQVPQHISIIMDGNGRWAKQKGHRRLFGHKSGVEAVRDVTTYCAEIGVKYLSLFAFSEENWDRPADEVKGLMELMFKSMLDERDTLLKNQIRFRVIGNTAHLSASLLAAIRKLEDETAAGSRMTMIVMLSYSGKWDILQAARHYAADCLAAGEQLPVDEARFSDYLATAGVPDPDLLVRTSGEQRISNYMLWQTAYTEFYYSPVLWPDFRRKDLEQAISDFNNRQRRYGKVE